MPTRTQGILDTVKESAVGKAVTSVVEAAVEYVTPKRKPAAAERGRATKQRPEPTARKAKVTKVAGRTAKAKAKGQAAPPEGAGKGRPAARPKR